MLRHKPRKNQRPEKQPDTGVPGLSARSLNESAAARGLFILLERCQQGGTRWVVYDRRSGGQVGLYWPGTMRAAAGGVEAGVPNWREGLRLIQRAVERSG
jgi:hypothetical protein